MAFRFGWEVFRARPGPLVGAVVVSYGLLIVVGLPVSFLVAALIAQEPTPVVVLVLLATVAVPLFALAAQLPTVWLLRAGVDAVEGRPVSFGRMVTVQGLGRALATAALVVAGVLLGYLFLIVPGIVFGVVASFALHFVVDERMAPTAAIRASIELVRSRPGPALGLFFIPAFAGGLGVYLCGIGIVVSLPVAMIAQVHGFRQLTGRPVPPQPPA